MFRRAKNYVERVLGRRTVTEQLYGKGGCSTYACEGVGIRVSPTDAGRTMEEIENKLTKRGIPFARYSFTFGDRRYKYTDSVEPFEKGFLFYNTTDPERAHIVSFKTENGVKKYYDINGLETLDELNSLYGKPEYLLNLL
jgi:hypothetical protein